MRGLAVFSMMLLAAPMARPADTDSTESVVKAVYAVISGLAGTRDWARFNALFAQGARLIVMRADGPSVMTPEEYGKRAGATFEKTAFYENELARKSEGFGGIAHVFSTYESRRGPGEKPFARGINSFQLVKEGSAWKVITVLWDTEKEGTPIPERYLR